MPLSSHPHARDAAVASECAAKQDRFATMHDVMFAMQDSLGMVDWNALGRLAGLADLGAFERCRRDPGHAQTLRRDSSDARSIGARGTPTSLVSGLKVRGAVTDRLLDSLLALQGLKPR
jgi:protein-disulfide isomerase